MTRHYGKYRGKVENNIDPMQLGRIQVSAPAVLGEGTLSWAMPCAPYGGNGVGFFAIPPVGANVWVEFEGGDPDWPIWAGCFWGTGEVPAVPAVAEMKVFKTDSINLVISDVAGAGGVTLEVKSPAATMPSKIVIDSNGITIEHSPGSIKMTQTSIEIKHTTPTVVIQASSVEVTNSPSTLKITTSEIEAANGSSKVKIAASGVDVESTATGKFSASGVELKNGGQSVNIGAANVSVNNGALEVM
jgi:uncharacterized protein involved in type VI secretion and phage assembly